MPNFRFARVFNHAGAIGFPFELGGGFLSLSFLYVPRNFLISIGTIFLPGILHPQSFICIDFILF